MHQNLDLCRHYVLFCISTAQHRNMHWLTSSTLSVWPQYSTLLTWLIFIHDSTAGTKRMKVCCGIVSLYLWARGYFANHPQRNTLIDGIIAQDHAKAPQTELPLNLCNHLCGHLLEWLHACGPGSEWLFTSAHSDAWFASGVMFSAPSSQEMGGY